MKTRPSSLCLVKHRAPDDPRWWMGYSGWTLYCALIGTFGITGYYADPLKGWLPDWLAVGLFTLPITILVLVQWGELPDRVVAVSHVVAAGLIMLAAFGMEIGHLLGYKPEGALLFRILAHLGWTFAWAGILRRAWRWKTVCRRNRGNDSVGSETGRGA